MSIIEAVDFLANLPDEKTREYELAVTAYATNLPPSQAESVLLQIINGSYPDKVCYNAFFCLNVVYRHAKDFYKLKELLENYSSRFDRHVTMDHLEALYYLESDAMYDYTELLKKTFRAAEFSPDHAGFVHLFADVFATIYEKDGLHDREDFVNKWCDDALRAADRAICLEPAYAKFYCTKARILAIKKDFSQALYNVDKAIGLENSKRSDYALRISTYQYHKLRIYTEMRLYELEQRYLAGAPVSAVAPRVTAAAPAIAQASQEELPFDGLRNYEEGKSYVFISYSHRDEERMQRLVSLLLKKGVRIWCDVHSIPTGLDYTEYIAEKIVACRVFMPLISSSSVKSEYVRKEIGMASRWEKKFFSVMLEDLMLSPGMDLQLGCEQRVNWYANTEEKSIELILRDLPAEVFI